MSDLDKYGLVLYPLLTCMWLTCLKGPSLNCEHAVRSPRPKSENYATKHVNF